MKRAISFRLSEEAHALLKNLAAKHGLSQASLLEMLIRKESNAPRAKGEK